MTKKSSAAVEPEKTIESEWSAEEIDLIKKTVARDATDEEIKLFLYTAKARGLNPLLKEIYFIKRKQKRGDRWIEVGTIQTGIDGFRVIANRTNRLRGIERGIKRDEKGRLYAWARVWRKDWDYPAYEEVALEEYKGETALWNRMPEQMLKKCAEAAALRMAFSEDLSGLFSHEEMEQADKAEEKPAESTASSQPVAAQPTLDEAVQVASDTYKMQQQAMKACLKTIAKLQEEHGLSKEEVQWATGLETLKGADLETLEKAVKNIFEYCESKSHTPKKLALR